MKQPVFTGSCTAMITPFHGGTLDETRMRKLLNFQLEGGTQAVVIAGTTGENATLDIHEYVRLVDVSVQHLGGRLKVIAGVGGNDTEACLRKAVAVQRLGANAVLMTPPYYNKTSQRGLLRHFHYVADSLEIPLILYNVPSRTVLGISAESYKALSHHENINGVKEASGDLSLISCIASECTGQLNLWCGNDDCTIPMMAMGALGVISVASNVIPSAVAELCRLCLEGDFAAARSFYARYAEFYRLLFAEVNPIPVKAAMAMAGMDSGTLRLPLVEMSADNREMLRASMKKIGVLQS